MKLDAITSAKVRLLLSNLVGTLPEKTVCVIAQRTANFLGENLVLDGIIGPKSIAAINRLSPADFGREFLQAVQSYFVDVCVRDPSQLQNLNDWLRQTHDLQDRLSDGLITPPQPQPSTGPKESNSTASPTSEMAPYEWARKELGVHEIPGSKHTPRIVWYHSFTTLKATDDETPWCSAFMCAAAESTGFKSTKSAAAISWKNYGKEGDGSVGDIAVFSRTGGNHVAFVNKKFTKGDSVVEVLGGNQGNKVSVANYSADRLLGFRRFVVS